MNKKEAIIKIAEETGLKKEDVTFAIDGFIRLIEETVSRGEKFTIQGFGSFERKILEDRVGRNPATGESLKLPESAYPKFSAGSRFKDTVKEYFLS